MRLWWTEMSADNKGSAARTLPCLTMLAAVHACFSVKNNSGLWMFMLSLNNKYFIGSIYAGTESCGSATERSVPHRSLLYQSKRLKILLGSEMFFFYVLKDVPQGWIYLTKHTIIFYKYLSCDGKVNSAAINPLEIILIYWFGTPKNRIIINVKKVVLLNILMGKCDILSGLSEK